LPSDEMRVNIFMIPDMGSWQPPNAQFGRNLGEKDFIFLDMFR